MIISMIILMNSIIFNIIVLPIKFVLLLIKAVWKWNFSNFKFIFYLTKLILIALGILLAKVVFNLNLVSRGKLLY